VSEAIAIIVRAICGVAFALRIFALYSKAWWPIWLFVVLGSARVACNALHGFAYSGITTQLENKLGCQNFITNPVLYSRFLGADLILSCITDTLVLFLTLIRIFPVVREACRLGAPQGLAYCVLRDEIIYYIPTVGFSFAIASLAFDQDSKVQFLVPPFFTTFQNMLVTRLLLNLQYRAAGPDVQLEWTGVQRTGPTLPDFVLTSNFAMMQADEETRGNPSMTAPSPERRCGEVVSIEYPYPLSLL